MARRVVEMLLPAQHVRDAHLLVVDDHGEVIGREAVALADHEVVERSPRRTRSRRAPRPPPRAARAACGSAPRAARARMRASAASRSKLAARTVAERARLGLRDASQRLELLGRLEGRVGEVARDQRVDDRARRARAAGLVERADATWVAADARRRYASGPSSQGMPSQARSSRIPVTAASEERARSVSSMRSRKRPPSRRASAQL